MEQLKTKRYAVLGIGKSGISAIRLLKKIGAEVIAINQGEVTSWSLYKEVKELLNHDEIFSQEDSRIKEILASRDIIIISPGISTKIPELELVNQKNIPIWSEIELGFYFAKSPIIAITGSNGKTTTVTFLGEMLKALGKKVFVGGNIGTAFCDYAIEILDQPNKYDLILLEISSFQLETTHKFHPHIATILNIYPTHGERYDTVLDYVAAKMNISNKMQKGDYVIYPTNVEELQHWKGRNNATVVPVNLADVNTIKKEISTNFDLTNYKLHGPHNLMNLYICLKVTQLLNCFHKETIQRVIDNFLGVPYRCQFIPAKKKYIIFNDAKSTNWDATLVALKSMEKENKKLSVIIGGQRRGKNDSIRPYLAEIYKYADQIILIGETTEQFAQEIGDVKKYIKAFTLDQTILTLDSEGYDGILLLSPAFPSFDQFKNYQERGSYFTKLVQSI